MTITLAQAIRNAIEGEKAAEQFYLELAAASREEETRDLLRQIAGEEREHATSLELVGRQLVGGMLPARADMAVAGIEHAPALLGSRDLGYEQALQLAVEAEESAVLFYDGLASSCSGEVAAFFIRVRGMEEGHAERVRAALRAGAPPAAVEDRRLKVAGR
jgi:rubrerythrin